MATSTRPTAGRDARDRHSARSRTGAVTGERIFAAAVACSAFAGAVGLMTGALDLGVELTHRLPLHSPVLAGIALALIVGVPTTIVAFAGGRGRRGMGATEIAAGALLVAWIVVEIAFIREFSFLQPTFALIGVVFVAIGLRLRARPTP